MGIIFFLYPLFPVLFPLFHPRQRIGVNQFLFVEFLPFVALFQIEITMTFFILVFVYCLLNWNLPLPLFRPSVGENHHNDTQNESEDHE